MDTPRKPNRNDVIARRILAAIAITHPFQLATKIEDILDEEIPSRRATAASRNGRGAVRVGDKVTSIEAATLVHVTRQRGTILRHLNTLHIAVTAAAIASKTGLKLSSASTRMKALVTNGLVREVGTAFEEGRHKITYQITELGRERIAA